MLKREEIFRDLTPADSEAKHIYRSPQSFHVGSRHNMSFRGALRSDQQIDVLLLTHDSDLRERLEYAFREKNYLILRAIKGSPAEIEDDFASVKLPQLLIVDLNTANISDVEALGRIKKTYLPNVPVIALSSYLDQDVVRSLVKIKIDDWLPKEAFPIEVYKSSERAIRRSEPEFSEQRDATCYSFLPVAGGAGNTTLAILTALILGKKKKNLERTCVVDLNFQDGMIADYLDLEPSFRIDELSNAPGRLDKQLLNVMLSRHQSGLSVLAPPRNPASYVDLSEGLVASVLGLISKNFETVIIDLPKSWYPWTDNVLWGSNMVYVVTPFTVPGLRQARFVADIVQGKLQKDAVVKVLVNRHRETFFNPGLSRKDAEKLLGAKLGGFLPDVGGIVEDAINRGLPLTEVFPASKLEKRLGEVLAGEAVQAS